MHAILDFHNAALKSLTSKLEPWLLPTLARFAFAATLLLYFWNSASLKLGDGVFNLSFGAYGQIFPIALEEAGYNTDNLTVFHTFVAFAGTYAEFILPALLLIGLFTRLAALGMIGFVAVQSYVDIFGHMADETAIGGWFNRVSDSAIMDQRLFWVTILLVLFVRGGGPLSVDRLVGVK